MSEQSDSASMVPGSTSKLDAVLPAAKNAVSWLKCHITLDRFLLVLSCVIGTTARFWKLSFPGAVVFDEFHFGKFTNYYNTGFYFFDIHPPLGKLTFYWIGWLFGYNAQICKYDNIHDPYAPECKYMILRYTAATFCSAILPVMYLTAREFGAGPWGAFLATSFIGLDFLHMIEGRLILTDSQLIFYIALCLYVGIRYLRRWNEHVYAEELQELQKIENPAEREMRIQWWRDRTEDVDSKDPMNPRLLSFSDRLKWACIVGITCGLAVSVKWTGLATPGMIALECFLGIFFLRRAVPFFDMLVMAVWAFIPYAFWFWAHFLLLPYSGDGDDFMLHEFQRNLIGNKHYDPNAPTQSFLASFYQLNWEMLAANARVDPHHPWASKWYSWPPNQRGMLYWSGGAGHNLHAQIYLLANPFTAWGVLLCMGLAVVVAALFVRFRHSGSGLTFGKGIRRFFAVQIYCIVAYTLNLLPYILVSRAAFIYHYLPGLYFAEVMAAVFVDRMAGSKAGVVVRLLFIVLAFGFYNYLPWIYAWGLTSEEHQNRRWLSTWD